MTALLEMVAAAGIGLFLGIVLTATYGAAALSRRQQKLLRMTYSPSAGAARRRSDGRVLQLTAGDGWSQPNTTQDWE